MKATLLQFWEATRASYWFIPSLMAVGAIVLSVVTTAVDTALGTDWLDQVGWLHANRPSGARALLSTIAGSMITVAGVTFSITIAAVSYATSQFGPRLLTNFMQDRGNQITLGTFIATFLYCLLVLRTIRSADEADTITPFVPHIAILCGVILALASIGVLIFFVHHVPESIHASNVVAGVGRDLNAQIEHLFPERVGRALLEDETDGAEEAHLPESFFEEAAPVEADGNGYLQYLDNEGLMKTATEHDLLLRVEYRPGDFVTEGRTLVLAWPAERVDEEVQHRILRAFAWGRQRTQTQDVRFLAQELVEIASRALSPGTNDPFTAMTCMDWLLSALSKLAQRELPGAFRYDDEESLRVVTHPVTFEGLADVVFAPMRPYVQADPNAALHLMKVIAELGYAVKSADDRRVLLRHAEHLKEGCEKSLSNPADLDAVAERYRTAVQMLREGTDRHVLADATKWLGGSA